MSRYSTANQWQVDLAFDRYAAPEAARKRIAPTAESCSCIWLAKRTGQLVAAPSTVATPTVNCAPGQIVSAPSLRGYHAFPKDRGHEQHEQHECESARQMCGASFHHAPTVPSREPGSRCRPGRSCRCRCTRRRCSPPPPGWLRRAAHWPRRLAECPSHLGRSRQSRSVRG
jgi:hypothetical protein